MTCIAALAQNGKVWMGGDSAVSNYGGDVSVRNDPKVFTNGLFLFGTCGSVRMKQLLRYSFSAPQRPDGVEDQAYLVNNVIDSIRRCFKEGGFLTTHEGAERGGQFLIGYKGVLYSVDCDFQVGINTNQMDAIGCGGDYALGALHATKGKPEARIRKALEISAECNGAVRGPFVVVSA